MMEVVAAHATEGERLSKENVLRDFVRYSWRATRGLADVAEAEGRELVSRLVALGRLTPDEGERVSETLRARMNLSRYVFESRVGSSVKTAVGEMETISAREVDRMSDLVSELERRVERLRAGRVGRS